MDQFQSCLFEPENWTGPDFQALLTAAEIFDFHMYFAMLKISDDNTEFTCSPGGKKKIPTSISALTTAEISGFHMYFRILNILMIIAMSIGFKEIMVHI